MKKKAKAARASMAFWSHQRMTERGDPPALKGSNCWCAGTEYHLVISASPVGRSSPLARLSRGSERTIAITGADARYLQVSSVQINLVTLHRQMQVQMQTPIANFICNRLRLEFTVSGDASDRYRHPSYKSCPSVLAMERRLARSLN